MATVAQLPTLLSKRTVAIAVGTAIDDVVISKRFIGIVYYASFSFYCRASSLALHWPALFVLKLLMFRGRFY